MEHLDRPYFVYGTLRPGWGNARLWKHREATARYDGETCVHGYELYAGEIPFAVPGDGMVVGALIYPHPTYAEGLRGNLDALEGHPRMYRRTECVALTPDGPVDAWIYVFQLDVTGCDLIPSGDFNDHLQGHYLRS